MNEDRSAGRAPSRQQGNARASTVSALLTTVALASAIAAPSTAQTADHPLLGTWKLNLERTRYGSTVERRSQETFVCEARGADIRCSIQGTRLDGRRVTGEFTASLDGRARAVNGIPDIDEVAMRTAGQGVVDATFRYRGAQVFGYRAFRSEDGKSLSFVSVAPGSRAVLSTLVVYDRQ